MSSVTERADTRRRQRVKRDPDYTVRARNGRGWMQVGVAWNRTNGKGLSIKLNSVPVGFDGVLKVLPPLEDLPEEQGQSQE